MRDINLHTAETSECEIGPLSEGAEDHGRGERGEDHRGSAQRTTDGVSAERTTE